MKPQGENLKVPDGWVVRTDQTGTDVDVGDDPETAEIYFVNMTPGWHITTGPRAIFYHPANTSEGTYMLNAKLHLFNPEGRNREAYGLLFGGKDLEGENQSYLYFVIRNTGEYLIKRRQGEETMVIEDWTGSDYIRIYDNPEVASVENTLGVEFDGTKLRFFINGQRVYTMDKGTYDPIGLYGLRVNHRMNLHVEDLTLSD
ncbi:hypothetical protein AB2B38_010085 [Balneola sp. MJW-20]